MESRIFQVTAAAVLLVAVAVAAPSTEQTIVKIGDKNPLKFEYGYVVADKEGNAQGHVQSRDGVYALGRYYVNTPSGSGQKVTYFADDWGYHPLVSYGNTSPKGSSRTQFAMGAKAIAALKDNGPPGNAIPVSVSPSFTTFGLVAAVQQPSALLAPPTPPSNVQASQNPVPNLEAKMAQDATGKRTILHIPELRKTLQEQSQQTNNRVNASHLVNLTAEIGSIGSDYPQEIIRLSSYLQPPENINSSYNSDVRTVSEQFTEEQQQNLYSSSSEVYLTTTMKPIVVSESESFILTNSNGQTGYNTIDPRTPDSATQSSNSIAVNEPEEGRNVADQLAPLQAGISILSSENVNPVQESIEGDQVSYKTEVDIQEGISIDVKQDENGNLHLASRFGDRVPKTKSTPIQGLGYERRLVHPEAYDIAREQDPIRREQKTADFIAKQEADVVAVQKSIKFLQDQIISQIDAEHEEVQKKQEPAAKAEALTQDQKSIQSSNTPIHISPSEKPEESQPVAAPVIPVHNVQQQILVPAVAVTEEEFPVETVQVDRESIGNNQIEVLPQRTVKSQNLAGILTLNTPEPQIHVEADKDAYDLVPPPITDHSEPVIVQPYPVEQASTLLPPPSPTLFPVKVETPIIIEKPTVVETTKVVEKPVVVKEPVEHTKIVEVEKPVPVLQPYPVEVTKYVHVDRPVAVPHPIPVSHPVPVPVAVPHAVEVPVPHLIPVPEILPIAVKEYYPIIIHKTKFKELRPKPKKVFTPESSGNVLFSTEGIKRPQQIDVQAYLNQHGGDLQFSDDGFKQDLFRGHHGHHRNSNVLRNLRIEYGFKPPLRPSVEITEEVKPSIYGPSVRSK